MRIKIDHKYLPQHALFEVQLEAENIFITGESQTSQDRQLLVEILGRLHEGDYIRFSAEDLELNRRAGRAKVTDLTLKEKIDPHGNGLLAYSLRLKKVD